MTVINESCCDKAITNGTLIRKGRANWVCPVCGKDQMLKLVWFHDCGFVYIPDKGLKKRKNNDR